MDQANAAFKFLGTASAAVLGLYLAGQTGISQNSTPAPQSRFAGPTSSQTLALDAAGTLLAVVNTDSNTVSFFDVANDRNRRLREINTGQEPWGVALNPLGTRAYIANTVSGTVMVMSINRNSPGLARVLTEIKVGTEPYGLCLTPNGTKLYVTNRSSNGVSVIDTASNRVIRTIENIGFHPRGCAVTNDGDGEDDDETLYVTQFFGIPNGKPDGEDDSKLGLVSVVRTVADELETTIQIIPTGDTGFKAAGDALAKVAPPATITEADLRFTTGAYANQLNSILVKGNFAYVPSVGASPNGPVRFDVNTQSLLSVLNLTTNKDTDQTINMHLAVARQTATPKLFVTVPWAIAGKNREDEAYVVSAASDHVVKVTLNRGTGVAAVVNDPAATGGTTRVLQIPTGKNPRGIVINGTDTRAYVSNYISRDVTVINIERGQDKVLATMQSDALPVSGSVWELIHVGKELYNSSTGEFDGPSPLSPKIRGRMSNNGWGSCASCHPDGLSDNVVWLFAAGPRRTIPQHADYDPDDPTQQRVFNWSGIFDEQEDFEANIRGVSGGQGLLVGDDGTSQAQPLAAFTPANANRRQLRSRGVNSWDAIKAYIQFGVRAPISPVDKNDPEVVAGERLFRQAGCQSCHGTVTWSNSRIRFTPPPAGDVLSNGQVIGELKKVGTFDPAAKNEVRATGAAPLGADGFAPPTLLSIFAFPKTFFHNGSADSLEQVMSNVTHRSAGSSGADLLAGEAQRRQLVRFLLSIDGSTPPIE